MRIKLITPLVLVSLLICLLSLSVVKAHDEPYSSTIIDLPGASGTTAHRINNAGQIVGQYAGVGFPSGVGFLLSGGSFTTIDFPGAANTDAYGINDAGQIVGVSKYPSGFSHGFLLSGGSFTTIDFPGASVTTAHGINNAGQIVGYYSDNGIYFGHGFLLSGGSFTTIDFPGASHTAAYGINDAGQIVGSYSYGVAGVSHGFLLSGGSFTTIDFPGASHTGAIGINNAGQIVGQQYKDMGSHGFLLSGGSFTTIDFPGANPTGAHGINNAGQIVGYYSDASGSRGFLLDKQPPSLFVTIPGINDHGVMMLWRAEEMFHYYDETTLQICESPASDACVSDRIKCLNNPSPDQVRQAIIEVSDKAKMKNKDITVDIDMGLEGYSILWEYLDPDGRWQSSVEWAGSMANIVSGAFREENPQGVRMLYAHSAGVDAANRGVAQKPGERMYDNVNLFNGRTSVDSLKFALAQSGYEWWRVKVFTNRWDLWASPWSLSNYGGARKWAGEAWVHLHCRDARIKSSGNGHSWLRDSINVSTGFELDLGLFGTREEVVGTVEYMMLRDWKEELANSIWRNIVAGDINWDGRVDLVDGILGLQVLSENTRAEEAAAHPSGDVSGDGEIGMEEVIHALRVSVGLQ